ncbi:MAG: HAD family hydrolase [Phycisphaeraceae bacterium]
MGHVRAILFDFGDTLVQFGRFDHTALFMRGAARTYHMWAARSASMPDFHRYYRHHWFAIHWGRVKSLLLRREPDATRLVRRACRKLWLQAEDPFFDELLWAWYSPLARIARVEPGTAELLARLRASGYRLGILSNTFVPGHVVDRHLERLGLLEHFPDRIYSCQVGYRKPHRRIFEAALARMHADADETLLVGDNLAADIRGGSQMGLRTVWKRPPSHPGRAPTGTPVIDRLSDLPGLLGRNGPVMPPTADRTDAACRPA